MELQPVKEQFMESNSIDEVIRESSSEGFMRANTSPIELDTLSSECIIPSFAKDNESTISHSEFLDVVGNVTQQVFSQETVLRPSIPVSHPIKGRIPEAMGKPAKELLDHEKTLYFERMAFIIEVPSIFETVNGNMISLTIGDVRAYNQENLYSRKTEERFKVFIGFKNQVCTNLCISTDGFKGDLKVRSTIELAKEIHSIISSFKGAKLLRNLSELSELSLTEHQFAQLIGKMRLYNYLPMQDRKVLSQIPIIDSQVSAIAKDYYSDTSFSRNGDGSINLWKLYNLFTGANKSSYIDTFLDRGASCLSFVEGLKIALNEGNDNWFLQ